MRRFDVAPWFLVAVSCASLSSAWAQTDTTPMGKTESQKVVEGKADPFLGSFALSQPIEVPQYRGLDPSLSISYDSASSNGIAGVGFHLGGLSTIERASGPGYLAGNSQFPGKGAPRYDASDVFILDGEVLVPCSALAAPVKSPSCTTAPSYPNYYSTKIESYRRIYNNTANNTWTVTDLSGRVTTYGAIDTSPGGGFTYKWGITSVTTPTGGTVTTASTTTYNWTTTAAAGADAYINTITYNGNTVRFNYAARPDVITFSNGRNLGRTDKRLISIEVLGAASAKIRAYALTYEAAVSPATGRSRLRTIQQFGRNYAIASGTITGGQSLPAMTFSWSNNDDGPAPAGTGFSTATTTQLGQIVPGFNAVFRQMADVNGDGKADMIGQTVNCAQCNVFVRLSNGDGTFAAAWPPLNIVGDLGAVVDIDGDGKADVLTNPGLGAVNVYLSTGTGFAAVKQTTYSSTLGYWKMGDVNGDGRMDVVSISTSNAVNVHLGLSGASAGTFAAPIPSTLNTFCFPRTPTSCGVGPPTVLQDMNGDGRDDLIVIQFTAGQIGGQPPFRDYYISTFLSNGNGTFGPTRVTTMLANGTFAPDGTTTESPVAYEFPDINGDGKPDMVAVGLWKIGPPPATINYGRYLYTYLGNGDGTWGTRTASTTDDPYAVNLGTRVLLPGDNNVTFVDLNGDRRADIASRNYFYYLAGGAPSAPDYVNFHFGNGDGTFATRIQKLFDDPCSTCMGKSATFADITGDGRLDLIRHTALAGADIFGISVYRRNGASATTSGIPDELTSFTNGYGGTTTIAYKSSTAWPACIPGETAPACTGNNPPVMRTVDSITVSDGRAATPDSTTTFSYAGGLYDRQDERFLGYRYAKKTMPRLTSGNSLWTNEAASPYEETWYLQSYGDYSKPAQTFLNSGASKRVQETYYTYLNNGAVIPYTSVLSQSQTWSFATDGITKKGTAVSSVYNDYGLVTTTTNWGFGTSPWLATGDEFRTENFYAVNTSKYIIKLADVQLFDAVTGGNKISETMTYYDGAAAWNTAPTAGNATKTLRWYKEGARFITDESHYDAYGNVDWTRDALGKATTFVFDTTYRLYPLQIRNPLDQLVLNVTTFDTTCLAATVSQDINSLTTTTTYDNLCRVTNVAYPLAGAYEARKYCGDAGMPACGSPETQYTRTESPSADGVSAQWLNAYFDGLGRVWRNETKGPASNSIFTDSVFDARGNVAERTVPYYTGGTISRVTEQYDTLGRVVRSTFPDNTSATFTYGTNDVLSIDEESHQSKKVLDAFGHTVSVESYDGSAWRNSTATFDDLGNLLTTTDPGGTVESYIYDSLGRKTQEVSPDRGTTSYVFDDAGNLLQVTDALSQITKFTYDELNREETKVSRFGTAQAVTRTFIYDQTRTGYKNLGKLTTVCTGVAPCDSAITPDQHRMNYDALGRLVFEVVSIDRVAYPFAMTYDLGGRLLSTKYPDGETVPTTGNITYDGAGRAKTITGFVNGATYNALGSPLVLTLANGTTTTRTYEIRNWLKSINTVKGSTQIQNMTFTRYKDSLIKTITGTAGASYEGWSNITYDGRHQMLNATNTTSSTYNRNYTYSPNGNIATRQLGTSGLQSYTYPAYNAARPHAVTNLNSSSYVYDAAGNMTSRAGTAIVYDGDNMPISVGANSAFRYGADGARIAKTENGWPTIYPRGDFEIRGCGTKYISLGALPIAKREGTANYWLHIDHVGSVQAVTDINGGITERRAYLPYGEETQTVGTRSESHGFTGQRSDETGLVYLSARYYDPTLGRFISADPTTSDGINRYMYGVNNPVGMVDPSGYGAEGAYANYVPMEERAAQFNTPSGISAATSQQIHASAYAAFQAEQSAQQDREAAELATAGGRAWYMTRETARGFAANIGKVAGTALLIVAAGTGNEQSTQSALAVAETYGYDRQLVDIGGTGLNAFMSAGMGGGKSGVKVENAPMMVPTGPQKYTQANGRLGLPGDTFSIPQGSTLTQVTQPGQVIQKSTAKAYIESGGAFAIDGGVTHLPGARVRDVWLTPEANAGAIAKNGSTVPRPMWLSQFVRENPGNNTVVSCQHALREASRGGPQKASEVKRSRD